VFPVPSGSPRHPEAGADHWPAAASALDTARCRLIRTDVAISALTIWLRGHQRLRGVDILGRNSSRHLEAGFDLAPRSLRGASFLS
jgi:hypothetical protein